MKRFVSWATAAGLGAALLGITPLGAPASDATGQTGPSILLVTFDTTRADRFGAYGYGGAATPTFDGLAERGVLFESAHAPTPITLPSHASILTGTYPSAHGVYDNMGFALAENATLVSEVFHQRGFRTAAFVASYNLDASMGLDQGFEVYRDPDVNPRTRTQSARRPAGDVVRDAIEWFAGVDPSERYFAWVHFYDPHQPLPEKDASGRELADPYQAAIDSCDRELGRLLRFLEKRGLSENLLVVVTADHGEGNGEHGEETHGMFLYRGVMRVPLVVSGGPVSRWKGVRVDWPVTTAAIAPMLLDLAGVSATEMPDVTLSPLLSAGDEDPTSRATEPLYLQTFLPYYTFQWRGLEGIVWNGYKLIRGARPELFALAGDPVEGRDLASSQPSRVKELDAALSKLVSQHPSLGWTESRAYDYDEEGLLASLGYVIGTSGNDPLDPTLPDPRDKLDEIELQGKFSDALARWSEVANRYETAWQRDEAGRKYLEQAHEYAKRLEHSKARVVLRARATVEYELKNYAEAAAIFEELVSVAPGDPTAHRMLAEARWMANQRDAAIPELETAISMAPKRHAYYQMLILWHMESDHGEEASRWMDRYAEAMEPGSRDRLEASEWIASRRRQLQPTRPGD